MNVTSLEKIKLLWQSHVFCIQLAKYMSNTCFGLYWYIYIITYAHVPRVTRVYFGIMVSCSSFPGCSHKSMWIWTITLSINHPIYIYSPRSLHCLIIGEYMVDHVPVGILSNTIYGSHHAQEHSAIWCNAYVNSTCVFCSKKNTFDMIIIIECSWIFNMKKYHTMKIKFLVLNFLHKERKCSSNFIYWSTSIELFFSFGRNDKNIISAQLFIRILSKTFS